MENEFFNKTRNSSDGIRFHQTQTSDKVDNNNPYKNRAGDSFGDYAPGSALKIVNNNYSDSRSMTPILRFEKQRDNVTEGNNNRRNLAKIVKTSNS